MKPEIERRFFSGTEAGIELRSGDTPKIRGLAAAYGKWSLDLGGFREIIAPGAFDDVLRSEELDVVALFDHAGQPLGRSTSGTLKLWTDERGLNYEIDPPDTQLARDVMSLMARGDLFGSSFAFTVETGSGEEWERDEDGGMRRTIKRFNGLYDVSVVTHAAYGNATSAALRSLERWQAEAAKPAPSPAAAARLVLAKARARAAVARTRANAR
jgi:HK97 family phage prohead protease